jgi:F-type H+-transporting ATPase subunit delta
MSDARSETDREDRHDSEVGAEQVAAVYAQAFLGAAEKTGQTQAMLDELDSLVRDVLDRLPQFDSVLSSALVSHEEKEALLDRALGRQASPTLMHFLKVVSRHGRLDILRVIHRQAHEFYNRALGRVTVRLTTATPIGEELAARIKENLRGLVPGEPVVHRAVDPAVIGGAVLRIGDTVYDGSIANQLETLRQQIIERSAHEIQSRRDRFRHPAGN